MKKWNHTTSHNQILGHNRNFQSTLQTHLQTVMSISLELLKSLIIREFQMVALTPLLTLKYMPLWESGLTILDLTAMATITVAD